MQMKSKFKKVLKIISPLILFALAIIIICLAVPNTVTGYVTCIDNGSPIANISVTDGRNVVKTDENGKFLISLWGKAHFITITTPSGYYTDNYYIRIDKSVKSYDFKLNISDVTANTPHSFIQISDTEIDEKGTGEWLDGLKNLVNETNPAFLIHTGDICYEEGLKKHIEEMNTDTMGCPVRYVIGNHDYVKGKYGEELYESLYGPVWYSFDVGNVHYVVTSFQSGSDYKSLYNKNDRWRWLEADLKNIDDDMRVVMFNHTNSPDENYVLSFSNKQLDLKRHNLIAWVFGHYHYNYVYENNGVVNISAPRPDCGGIDSSVAGARVVSIDENFNISTKMKYYDLSDGNLPKDILWQNDVRGNILFCDTVYENGFIYTATSYDDYPDNESGVFCFNDETGEQIWYYHTDNSVKNNIVISNDKLLVQDVQGNVYCLDCTSGILIWKIKVDIGSALGTSSGICKKDNTLFCGSPRSISAVDIETGNILWNTIRKKGENSAAEFMICNDKLIVSSHWDSLCALDVTNGKELWSNSDDTIRFRSSTPLAIENNLLVADDDSIMMVDSETGKIISKTTLDGYVLSSSASPAYKDGIAYIPTANKGVVAFNIESLSVVRTFETEENTLFTAPYVAKGNSTVESTPVIYSDTVVFGANDGMVYSFNIYDGTITGKYVMNSAVLGKVVVTQNKVFAGGFNGKIACFSR